MLLLLFYISLSDVRIPVKSHAFSVSVMLQDIKSHSHVHANTKIDDLELTVKQPLAYVVERYSLFLLINKGNNKITELRSILQRESQNS